MSFCIFWGKKNVHMSEEIPFWTYCIAFRINLQEVLPFHYLFLKFWCPSVGMMKTSWHCPCENDINANIWFLWEVLISHPITKRYILWDQLYFPFIDILSDCTSSKYRKALQDLWCFVTSNANCDHGVRVLLMNVWTYVFGNSSPKALTYGVFFLNFVFGQY